MKALSIWSLQVHVAIELNKFSKGKSQKKNRDSSDVAFVPGQYRSQNQIYGVTKISYVTFSVKIFPTIFFISHCQYLSSKNNYYVLFHRYVTKR